MLQMTTPTTLITMNRWNEAEPVRLMSQIRTRQRVPKSPAAWAACSHHRAPFSWKTPTAITINVRKYERPAETSCTTPVVTSAIKSAMAHAVNSSPTSSLGDIGRRQMESTAICLLYDWLNATFCRLYSRNPKPFAAVIGTLTVHLAGHHMPLRLFAAIRTRADITTFLICVGLLCLPAVYNGYPLFYPDSIGYIHFGPPVARMVFLGQMSYDYGFRSAWYTLSILPLHWMTTAWPIIFFHALLTAYVVRLTIRRLVPTIGLASELAIFLVLATATSAGWYVSLVQPDFLAPLTILSVYLLTTGWRTLARRHRIGLCAVLWYAIVSHNSHLPLACGLLLVAVTWHLAARSPWRDTMRQVAPVAIVIACAIAAQFAIHARLHGQPSMFGKGLPFLTARVIADGPGADYLREHCDEHNWIICQYRGDLPTSMREFLWEPDGVWTSADLVTRERLRAEEFAFVAAVLRTYPVRQMKATMANIRSQAMSFDLWTFGSHPDVNHTIRRRVPAMAAAYSQARQRRASLNIDLFSSICRRTVYFSALAVPVLLVVCRRRSACPAALLGFALFILLGVVGNLALGAGLSVATDRLHARAIWLIPLLAMLLTVSLVFDRRPGDLPSPS